MNDIQKRAREICERHLEYMGGLERGQNMTKVSNMIAAVEEALSVGETNRPGYGWKMSEAAAREIEETRRVQPDHGDTVFRATPPPDRVKVLEEALEAVLASSGARGRYHALEYADAVERAEAALKETPA